MARQRFAGKRVLVVGVAREGLSLVRFLAAAGAHVTANDRARALPGTAAAVLRELGVEAILGGHPEEAFLSSDVVFVSPGVPQQVPAIVAARQAGVPVSSETQLFFELCRGIIVGITGSSGKTTTTALTGEMFREAGMPAHVGGNIGTPLLEKLDEIRPEDWALLELSSFQLETLPYSPPVAAILNITPNHLDRHAGMEEYAEAKRNILRFQREGDRAVLSADDPIGRAIPTVVTPTWFSIEREVDGGFVAGGQVRLRRGDTIEPVCGVEDVRLRGRHNLSNVVAAVAIASCAGVPIPAMRKAISEFTGVAHRLEIVGEVGGVLYCNDSIATSPERAIAGLRSFSEPVVLIAGGRNKKLPMGDWAQEINRRARALVVMGEAADEIEEAVRAVDDANTLPLVRAGSLDDAIISAAGLAVPGDVVLLSPGCTSFDMFKDFEERGKHFRQTVQSLQAGGERR